MKSIDRVQNVIVKTLSNLPITKDPKNIKKPSFWQRYTEEEDEPVNISSETHAWLWIIGMMLVMGGASHLLVEASIKLGELAGIDAVIMGFVVIAAGTSVPDTVLSVIRAKRGNYDAAISNVLGSNIGKDP